MITIKDKSLCCGCFSCAQACPRQCIQRFEDEEGFAYPQVNASECINCGLCEKVCPIIKCESTHGEYHTKGFVAYAKDDELRSVSSSGGIFGVCAKAILRRSGVVFGAALDENFQLRHIAVTTVDELPKLYGSKYLQSDIGNTYKEAKMALLKGKPVLYTGTACQISGLMNYLGGQRFPELFTIDVLCHGVPSPKLWKQYVAEKQSEYGSALTDVSFRSKITGWKHYSLEMGFEDKKQYFKSLNEDGYLKIFLSNICLRPSCYSCKFKSLERSSDLSIGDCWGIEKYMPDMDDNRGTSVVIVQSKQGEELWSYICDELVYREADIDRALPPTAHARKSVLRPLKRDRFFKALTQGATIKELGKLADISLLRRMVRLARKVIKK